MNQKTGLTGNLSCVRRSTLKWCVLQMSFFFFLAAPLVSLLRMLFVSFYLLFERPCSYFPPKIDAFRQFSFQGCISVSCVP